MALPQSFWWFLGLCHFQVLPRSDVLGHVMLWSPMSLPPKFLADRHDLATLRLERDRCLMNGLGITQLLTSTESFVRSLQKGLFYPELDFVNRNRWFRLWFPKWSRLCCWLALTRKVSLYHVLFWSGRSNTADMNTWDCSCKWKVYKCCLSHSLCSHP